MKVLGSLVVCMGVGLFSGVVWYHTICEVPRDASSANPHTMFAVAIVATALAGLLLTSFAFGNNLMPAMVNVPLILAAFMLAFRPKNEFFSIVQSWGEWAIEHGSQQVSQWM